MLKKLIREKSFLTSSELPMKFVGELEDEVVEDSWVVLVEASSLPLFSF